MPAQPSDALQSAPAADVAVLSATRSPARPVDPRPLRFHRSLPGYRPTPLRPLPAVAAELGLRSVHVKDESDRFGLPAFKVLGASWAIWRALTAEFCPTASPEQGFEPLRRALHGTGLVLVAATEGNHGRAVAWVARSLGIGAEVYLSATAPAAARRAIAAEGASVVVVDGNYDVAVAAAEDSADGCRRVIADVARRPDDDVPAWVIDGYSTLFAELEGDDRLDFDVVFVPAGVGALTAAAVRHMRQHRPATRVVVVEPLGAACVLASVRRGTPVTLAEVDGAFLAGLNCPTPSAVAWPELSTGLSAVLAVDERRTQQAVNVLDEAGLTLGATGAAACAGLLEAMNGNHADLRTALGLAGDARVLLLGTEGRSGPV